MTQNFTSGSNVHDHDDNQTSDEIRSEIGKTRASVGNKIDQLQERLDPSRLKEQAQETVQEMLSDTANSVTDYVRNHKDEMITSLGDAARRNPLPTALIGLGVGWLLLESMGGNKSRDEGWEYERRNLRGRQPRSRFEDSIGRNYVSQGRGTSMEEGYYSRVDNLDYGRASYAGNAEFASQAGTAQPYSQDRPQGTNLLAKAADTVKESVGDAGHEIKTRVGDLKDSVSDTISNVGGTISGAVEDVRRQVGYAGDTAQQSMRGAEHQMNEWQDRALNEGERRGQQFVRNLEDNPLTYGALALAAGAALAMLLPQTRTENRAFGESRDQLMERGQKVMETAKSHAQEVVAEVQPELEEKARQIISDVKQTGKEAIQDATQTLQPVVDKAISTAKDEARGAAREVGVDPDKISEKLGDNRPMLNRDTLKGQWKQVKGEVKRKWGQLTDDELTTVEGDYDKLVGKIQSRYGYERARAEQEVNDFFKSRKA